MTALEASAPSLTPARTPLVSCYYIGDFERNRYDDSDFYVVYWDDVKRQIVTAEFGSTRYGGGWDYNAELIRDIPADVLCRIQADAYTRALSHFTRAETKRVLEPQPADLGFGVPVRFVRSSNKRAKVAFADGEGGECFWQGWRGTFYTNGYNKRGRHNGRLGVRMSDGRRVFCSMADVRLDREPDLASAERAAKEASTSLDCPGAWWTRRNAQIAR